LLVPHEIAVGGSETVADVVRASVRRRHRDTGLATKLGIGLSAVVDRALSAYSAVFTCTQSLSGASVVRCRRFCESGHSGSTSTRMSGRSQRTFTFGRPRVSASFGWRRPSVWLPTGEYGLTTYGALSGWFSIIMTF